MENVLPFSTLYSRPDAFRHLPSSGALTCKCYSLYEAYLFLFGFSGKRGSVGSSLSNSGTIARVNMFLFIN